MCGRIENSPAPKRSRIRLVLGYAVVLASVAFTFDYLHINADQFLRALSAIELRPVMFAFALFFLMLGVNAAAFALACRAFGAAVPTRVLCGAWLASLLAKYLPGGVGHVAGRGMVLNSHGIPWRNIGATGFFEQVASLAWCTSFAWALHAKGAIFSSRTMAVAGGAMLIGCVLLYALRRARWLLSVEMAATSLFLYSVAMLPYMAGYVVLVDPVSVTSFGSSLFAGTIAGTLAIVAPGGLGVRESVVAAVSVGDADGLLAGLLVARLLILVAEVLASLCGWWLLRDRPKVGADGRE